MSSLTIFIIACIARVDLALSLPLISWGNTRGTTCQETPKRSTSQPHWISLPPSVSLAQ